MIKLLFPLLLALANPEEHFQKSCLEEIRASALALTADAGGDLHLIWVKKMGGVLHYARVDATGLWEEERVAEGISRSPNFLLGYPGLLLDPEGAPLICFHNVMLGQLELARRGPEGWSREVLDGEAAGQGCALAFIEGRLNLFYERNAALARLEEQPGGGWRREFLDDPGFSVGGMPAIAQSPEGALLLAHRGEPPSLRLSLWRGEGWQSWSPDLPWARSGREPFPIFEGEEWHVYHGVDPESPGIDADLFLVKTWEEGSQLLPEESVGGSLGGEQMGEQVRLISRRRLRSALFGSQDSLLLYEGEPLKALTLEHSSAAQRRHQYRLTRLAHDPFALPVLAWLVDLSPYMGEPAESQLCLMRPWDRDRDRIPDEVELELGLDPEEADTDGDGRSDGEELLLDDTDPLHPDGCQVAEEICNGLDDDCDGETDEGLDEACYSGPEGSAGRGICGAGVRSCRGGIWGLCVGEHLPKVERCNGLDDDCDGELDEGFQEMRACDTGLPGHCAQGTLSCAGRLGFRCEVPEAQPEICDGEDNDCDGEIDEGQRACGQGACYREVAACVQGALQACIPGPAAPADLRCDGVDEDCDGLIDEEYPEGISRCGLGACMREGWRRCEAGQELDDCQPGAPALNDALCDGVDEDCDGEIDEEYLERESRCGLGICQAFGLRSCQGGEELDSCRAGLAQEEGQSCDGLDQDCDGLVDEEYQPEEISCGLGACRRSGWRRCLEGTLIEECQAGLPPAVDDRRCDGIDEDCDGEIDEEYQPRSISCGLGACEREGFIRCEEGEELLDCQPGAPAALDERCDGIDEDCDGLIDEEVQEEEIRCGIGICERSGWRRCREGQLIDVCSAGEPQEADLHCDGLDEDCDGQIDEEAAPRPWRCGLGACEREGISRCIQGAWRLECQPGQPEEADLRCDGIDEDCEGKIDDEELTQQI